MDTSRRAYLAALGGAATTALAGCLNGDSTDGEKVESLPAPVLGEEDAPVTMMVFEDFQCPHCKNFNDQIAPQIIEEYVNTGDVRYEHHDFPVLGQTSVQAANAARSVQNHQDDAAFWDYVKMLYDNQNALGFGLFEDAATEVGADGETVVSEARSMTYKPVIDADTSLARDHGAEGTPTVVVDGEKVDAGRNYTRNIALAIEDALSQQ